MFTGIVHCCSPILSCTKRNQVLEILVKRPPSFKDIKVGDSLSVDGVCLTVEKFSEKDITFAIGDKTLQVTQWNELSLNKKLVNLELSLKMSDLVAGDFLTGHVDDVAIVRETQVNGENKMVGFEIPSEYKKLIWKKGFIALNGVSLTVHSIKANQVQVHLIPETLKATNLSHLSAGHKPTFEISFLAKAFENFYENSLINKRS